MKSKIKNVTSKVFNLIAKKEMQKKKPDKSKSQNVGKDFTTKNSFSDDDDEEEKDNHRQSDTKVSKPANKSKESNVNRFKQVQSLQTVDGMYAKRKDERFDLIIDNNDDDFDDKDSDEDEDEEKEKATPEKRKHEPMPEEYQRIPKENPKNQEKDDHKDHNTKKQKSRSPTRDFEYKRQEGLLEEWEKKYGGKNKRKFYQDQKMNMNSWQVGDGGYIKEQLIDSQNSPDSPKGGVHITGDVGGEFEYDWDDDANTHNDELKVRKHKSSKVAKSRVPYGAMPFADNN
jgi:hypothetical protein